MLTFDKKTIYKPIRILFSNEKTTIHDVVNILNNKKYIIKEINKSKTKIKNIHNEITILKKLRNNKNIIQLIDYFETKEKCFIILERLSNVHDLYDVLRKRNISKEEAIILFSKIVNIIIDLYHNYKIVHYDIKDENILVDTTIDSIIKTDINIKLIDFELSTYNKKDYYKYDENIVGTLEYSAPEMIHKTYQVEDEPITVWSLGVLLYCLLSPSYPFPKEHIETNNYI